MAAVNFWGWVLVCGWFEGEKIAGGEELRFCGTKALTAIARSPQEMKMAADERR
jgi:hypothetical protein